MNNNTHRMNKQISYTLAGCSLVVIALMILKSIGIFSFDGALAYAIPIVGFWSTLTPIILYHFKAKDSFMKYYVSFAMALFIGVLGCFNGIGIYITFVLVPVASCLYYDTLYTIICSLFSYVVMVIAVYFNSAGKMEVTYYGWSHLYTFRAYIIGFTMEYIVVCLFLAQIMQRAKEMLREQHMSDLNQKAQNVRHQLLIKETKDIVFEFYPKEGRFIANRSMYQSPDEENTPIEYECFYKDIPKYPGLQEMYNRVTENIFDENQSDTFEADMSYEKEGVKIPLWFSVECFVVRDGDSPVTVIGKMHDITRIKKMQDDIRRSSLERMYDDSKRRNSLYEQVMAESANFNEHDFDRLADGHRFIAEVLEEVKYSEDLIGGINKMLSRMGEYFKMDRICVIETDTSSGTNSINYQWNRKESTCLEDYFSHMSHEDLIKVNEMYDKNGYIEINPKKNIVPMAGARKELLDNAVYKVILGNQLWIPMLTNGKYTGAVSFDRVDSTEYSFIEKLLISEAVTTLSAFVLKINAENANKAKSDFLSTMSHEIRTPMNAIVGMTEVALREDMPENVKNNLNMVKSSAFGLLTLINDILDYSKIEAGRFEIVPENFSLLSILNDVKAIAVARNAGKLELKFDIPADLPTKIYGDSVRIRQVMINYCTNAIKYSDKGTVNIIASFDKINEKSGILHFAVKDQGIGIKKEDLAKLFKSYTRVDTTVNHHKEGTGLGLAISRQLVELMNGNVNVESEYGEGSTFSFAIPVGVEDWKPAGTLEDFKYSDKEETEEEVKPVIAPTAHVLVVDDNRVNIVVAKALLKPTKVIIDTAESGAEALLKIKETDYDIVFMDHFMPEMDGVETTQHIRNMADESKKNVPIVALTADAMSGVREELLGHGMNDFLTKPIIVKNLYEVLKRWLPKEKIESN